jgi:hypothetical protein
MSWPTSSKTPTGSTWLHGFCEQPARSGVGVRLNDIFRREMNARRAKQTPPLSPAQRQQREERAERERQEREAEQERQRETQERADQALRTGQQSGGKSTPWGAP